MIAKVGEKIVKVKKVIDDSIIFTDLGDCDTDDEIDDWDIQYEGSNVFK